MRILVFIMGIFAMTIQQPINAEPTNKPQEAIFAMGCFWCGAAAFKDHKTKAKLSGVISIRSGYTGGTSPNPTYESHKGYKEAVKVVYDPHIISYKDILDIFWHNVDPFDAGGQFCDRGDPYTSAIFYTNDDQKTEAEATKNFLQKALKQPILTEIIPADKFYDAEEYHQDYDEKNPIRYNYYRWGCGRDARLKAVWEQHQNNDPNESN